MNGNFEHPSDGTHPDDNAAGRDSNVLDPELLQLFATTARQEATAPGAAAAAFEAPPSRAATDEVFVSALMLKIQQARRLNLARRAAGITTIMAGSAFLAPYVAQQTLVVAGWFTDQLPATGTAFLSPMGLLCAALVTWGVARRARSY